MHFQKQTTMNIKKIISITILATIIFCTNNTIFAAASQLILRSASDATKYITVDNVNPTDIAAQLERKIQEQYGIPHNYLTICWQIKRQDRFGRIHTTTYEPQNDEPAIPADPENIQVVLQLHAAYEHLFLSQAREQ